MERRNSNVFLYPAMVCMVALFFLSFKSADKCCANRPLKEVLSDSIMRIVSACPGEIGVAVIINNTDTVRGNDKSVYPLMSVFKVHQALALCADFDNKDILLDTLIKINRNERKELLAKQTYEFWRS